MKNISYKKQDCKYNVYVNGVFIGTTEKYETASRSFWGFTLINKDIPTGVSINSVEYNGCNEWGNTRNSSVFGVIGDFILKN